MLRGELDEPAIQQRTGCRLHASYLAPRLRWLQTTQSGTFAAAARWMSVGEYVYLRLLGTTAAGTSIAAWTGLLDRRTGRWDDELVTAAGLRAGQLSDIRDPTEPFDDTGSVIGSRWPALASSVWLPVVADGIAGNIGAGATDEQAQALAAATSGAIRVLLHHTPAAVPSGLWCYRVDCDRSLLGGAVNDVGRVVSWLSQTLRLPDHLDLSAAPDPAAPLVLPYLSGERSTDGLPRRVRRSPACRPPPPPRCWPGAPSKAWPSAMPGSPAICPARPGRPGRSWPAEGSPRTCPACCSFSPTLSACRSPP
jgi:gluconokinase